MVRIRSWLASYFEKAEFSYMILGFGYLALYTIQVLVEPPADIYRGIEIASDLIYWIFAVDLALRILHMGRALLTWAGLIKFFSQNWLALAALILPAFRSLRVLRVIIVLRGLAPFLKTRSSKVGMVIGVTLPLLLYTSALAIFEAERYAEGANITSFGDAVWWAFASVTTVGYGDRFPVTLDGRFIATMLMVVGIGLFSSLTALLAAWVMGERQKQQES